MEHQAISWFRNKYVADDVLLFLIVNVFWDECGGVSSVMLHHKRVHHLSIEMKNIEKSGVIQA